MNLRKMLVGATMTVAGICITGTSFAETLRFAEFGPNRGTRAEALNWFADELKSRSNGELEIEFYWGKSLLGTKAVLQGLGDGVADMGSVIGFFTPKKLRAYNMGDLPVANADEWIGMRALYEISSGNERMTREFAENGLVYVTNYTTGPVQLICTKPVKTLTDLQGVKLRGSGPYGKTMGDMGAEVQSMGQAKVYQALESGLVECNQNYYYSMKAYKQYEVADYVTELNWGQNMAFGIFMNKDSWARLKPEHQKLIGALGSEFIDFVAQRMIEGKAADKAAMEAGIDGKKITVFPLAADERASLLAASTEYIDEWVSEATADGYDGQGLLDEYLSLVDKYSKEQLDKDYPWAR